MMKKSMVTVALYSARRARAGAALALCGAIAACNPHDNALRNELRDEKSKWQALSLHNYTYDFERSCFCGDPGAVQITVANDVLTKVVSKSSGQAVPTSPNDNYYTIPELYDYLIDATTRADEVSVHFDTPTHLPTLVYIDFIRNAIDDELGMTIGNLVSVSSPQVFAANRPAGSQIP